MEEFDSILNPTQWLIDTHIFVFSKVFKFVFQYNEFVRNRVEIVDPTVAKAITGAMTTPELWDLAKIYIRKVRDWRWHEKSLLIFPICLFENHWILILFIRNHRQILVLDSLVNDPLAYSRSISALCHVLNISTSYTDERWSCNFIDFYTDENGKFNDLHICSWSIWCPRECAIQTNAHDCGVFCLMWIKMLRSEGATKDFVTFEGGCEMRRNIYDFVKTFYTAMAESNFFKDSSKRVRSSPEMAALSKDECYRRFVAMHDKVTNAMRDRDPTEYSPLFTYTWYLKNLQNV